MSMLMKSQSVAIQVNATEQFRIQVHTFIRWNYLVEHYKQYHKKVLLSGFNLNGHTLGFHPQTQTLELACIA